MIISRHSRKIAISFIIVLGLSLAMIIFDLSRMRIMQSKLDSITKEHNIKSDLMTSIRHAIYARRVSLRNILLMADPFEKDMEKTIFNSYAVNIVAERNKFSSMRLNEKEKKLLGEINVLMALAYQAQVSLIEESIYQDKILGKDELQKAFETQQVFIDKLKQMIMMQKEATKKAVADAEQSYSSAKTSVYILGGSALLFGILLLCLLSG